MLPVAGQLSRFDYYRQTVGFSWYLLMIPALVAQGAALWQLLPATVAWSRSPTKNGALLLTGWVILAGAVGLVAFHASRFPYFYIVFGLYPAAAGAVAVGWLLLWLRETRARLLLLGVVWIPMAWTAAQEARGMLADDLTHQRASLAFVEEAFTPSARGFGDRHEFVCRSDQNPFPLRSRINIERDFYGEGALERTEVFLNEFRRRPVAFMIPSIEARRYPDRIQEFWRSHYVTYFGHVAVPGRRMAGPWGSGALFEPLVAGSYRWWPDADGTLRVGDRELQPGESITLPQEVSVDLILVEGGGGIFALQTDRPPAPDLSHFFTRYLERRQAGELP